VTTNIETRESAGEPRRHRSGQADAGRGALAGFHKRKLARAASPTGLALNGPNLCPLGKSRLMWRHR
jgi:hypothetical protein